MTTLQTFQVQGWLESIGEGVSTVYLSIADEGMTTLPTDTPANTVFRPRILDPEQFSIKRSPQHWVHGGSMNMAAFGQLRIDNYDGAFDFLLSADLRDSTVKIQLPKAGMLQTATAINDAFLFATAIIDTITSDTEDVITVTLKDTLARLDKTLPCKFNSPYVAQGAANVMVPLSFGACRNVQPLLVDTANRIFELHDSNIPNVAGVFDKAAQLDPGANPPQYTPALSGSGIQLQAMPSGLLTCDLSSFGVQAAIQGVNDVLAGAGGFTGTWTGSPLVPPGWAWTNNSGSSITERQNPPYTMLGAVNGALLKSTIALSPANGKFGDALHYDSILNPNTTYRLTFSTYNIQQSQPSLLNGMVGGVFVATALDTNPTSYITGINVPLTQPQFFTNTTVQNFAFEFTMPSGSSAKNLYIGVCASAGSTAGTAVGNCTATIFNVKLEQVGQYTALPLSAIPMADYFTEILCNRAGEATSIFNSAEAAAIAVHPISADDPLKTGLVPFGVHFDAPPNIIQALAGPCASFGAVLFSDASGTIRVRRLVDPSDPANTGTVKAAFTQANVERPIQVKTDPASNLTTLFGARRNWKTFTKADFVTDQALVPEDEKTRYMRPSQFWVTSSLVPAGEYAFAVKAPVFDTLMDLSADCQLEADRVNGIFSPRIYTNGTFSTGKRRQIVFTAFYDDPSAVGIGTTAAVTDLQYGDIVTLDYPTHGFSTQLSEIIEWELFPFANKVTLTVEI